MRPALLLLPLSIACATPAADVGAPTVPTGSGTTPTAPAVRPLAGGLSIAKLSVYQGVEAVLWEDGAVPSSLEAPIVVGRPAFVRVFVEPEAGFDRKVTGILTVRTADGDTVLESNRKVDGPSVDGDLKTTINFDLPGDLVKRTLALSVEIVEETPEGPGGGDPADVTWDSEDWGGLDVQTTDDLTLVIVPIRYQADGSNRLPDTSEAQLQRIADLAMGIYPAKSVQVRVDPPLNWSRRIDPWDSGDWSDLLYTLQQMRDDANEAPNTYYYGMFNATDNLGQFCQSGCILGLSGLAWNVADPAFRASIGIGYSGDTAVETMVHEIGHAHGREHAPCGLGGQPSDRGYPYANASIGAWGYDLIEGELRDPRTTVDMMSYCAPIWTSDYTYYNLLLRMQALARQARSAPRKVTALTVLGDGVARLRGTLDLTPGGGLPIEVELFDAAGMPAGYAAAELYPYDHIDGGIVALEEDLPEGWTARVLPGR